MEDNIKGTPLKNPRWELFCQYYSSYDRELLGNGVQSYALAYDIDLTEKGGYSTCRANASKLLTKADILTRIRELLDLGPLNDAFVDRELAFVILQNAELSPKVAAIKEYNALKSRVTEKLDIKMNSTIKGVKFRIIEDEEKNEEKEGESSGTENKPEAEPSPQSPVVE